MVSKKTRAKEPAPSRGEWSELQGRPMSKHAPDAEAAIRAVSAWHDAVDSWLWSVCGLLGRRATAFGVDSDASSRRSLELQLDDAWRDDSPRRDLIMVNRQVAEVCETMGIDSTRLLDLDAFLGTEPAWFPGMHERFYSKRPSGCPPITCPQVEEARVTVERVLLVAKRAFQEQPEQQQTRRPRRKTAEDHPPTITASEAASELEIPRTTLDGWTSRGLRKLGRLGVLATRPGGERVFLRDDVLKFAHASRAWKGARERT